MRVPRALTSLRNYNFRLFWFGQLISLIGTWMQAVGQAWLVLKLSNSPLALGTVAALQFLPVTILTLFAGVIVDRLPKRRMLLVTQSTAMAQAFVLAVLVSTNQVQLWHVYVLAAVLGLVNAFDNPTRQSFVIEMVGREDVVNAVALNSTLFNTARIVGPAVGGVLIATIGLSECFYVNAFSFIAVLIGLLLMRESQLHAPRHRPQGHILRQLGEGLQYAARTPAVLVIVILMGTLGTFGYNFNTVLPLLAKNALGVDAAGYGALVSAMGVGSLVAALVLANSGRVTTRRLFLGAAGFSLLLGAVAASRWYPLSLAILLPLGFASILFTTGANTTLQLEVPDTLRGRVMSLYTLLFLGSTPIGGLVTGFLAEQFGIQWTLAAEAAICAAGVVAAAIYWLGVVRRSAPPREVVATPTGGDGS